MSSESNRANATSRIQSSRRYWRRVDTPQSWWPWGFIPAAGLALLFLFGALFTAPRIEAEVRNQVAEQFDGAGLVATKIESSGQGVDVHAGAVGNDTVFLHSLAKATQCETWVGELTCPTSVNVVVEPAEAETALLTRRPHPFTIARTDDTVTLSGEVPSVAEHDRIVNLAGQHFDIVNDDLRISDESATDDDKRAVDASVALVSELSSGQASWSGRALTVTGVASSGGALAAREHYEAFDSGPLRGGFDVRALGAAQRCNEGFRDIFSQASVRFQTGSATIDAGNDELLAQLAQLAQSCPGSLMVEGHTDSRGDAGMNKALSLARASAVRDALVELGVDARRVTATGLGATQPIADNATADGRAQNRRIAITINETN